MVRMHCNREVIRLPDDGTVIRRLCTVCETVFKQRKTGKRAPVGTLPPSAYRTVLIDLKTGEPIKL